MLLRAFSWNGNALSSVKWNSLILHGKVRAFSGNWGHFRENAGIFMKCRHFQKMPAFSGNAPIYAGIFAGIFENAGIFTLRNAGIFPEMPAFLPSLRAFLPAFLKMPHFLPSGEGIFRNAGIFTLSFLTPI